MENGLPALFDQLVHQVIEAAGSPDPLARLDAAVVTAAGTAVTGDRLLDHFVAEARQAGLTWTDIGAHLGVSKQAARQRFAERTQSLVLGAAEPDSRLQACLDRACAVAQHDGAPAVDTHHLLSGLLTEGVAAAILERLGVTGDAIGETSHRLFGPAREPGLAPPPMTVEATDALEAAARHAGTVGLNSSHPQVRTEHLLFVLAFDSGSRARRVLNDLGVNLAAIKRELDCVVTEKPRRFGNRWKRSATATDRTCSFCGRPEKVAGRLVNGPAVYICANCVAIAADVLNTTPQREAGSQITGPPPTAAGTA
jgi:hypothetical protein